MTRAEVVGTQGPWRVEKPTRTAPVVLAIGARAADATGALFNPMASHFGRAVRENGGLFHQALFKTDTLAVLQINGGNNQHDFSKGKEFGRSAYGCHSTKFFSSCSPS